MIKPEFVDYINSFERQPGEYTEDEVYEICTKFCEQISLGERNWDELQGLLGTIGRNGLPRKGEALRTHFKAMRYERGEVVHNEKMLSGQNIDGLTFPEFEEKTEELKRELYKQQVKTRDSWNAYRKTMRKEAREEDFRDLLLQAIEKGHGKLEPKDFNESVVVDDNEMIVLFSDLHLGVEIDKYFNKYNAEIARERVRRYFDNILDRAALEHPVKIHFINLGDNCSGHLHVTGRLEQEIDVIEQITTACEILAENLSRLQDAAPEVYYRSCTDNHSRMTPSFKENLEKENYSRLIDFYLEARLKDTNIIFAKDNLDEEVGLFTLLNGKKVVFAHGHHDNYNQAIQSYMGATKEFIDYVLLGHFHSSKMKSFQGGKVIINGSIVGSDQYAYSKRLFDDPEQLILVSQGDNLSIHTINLK